MRELIQRLAATATVVLSTHIMQEVDAICDRALILRDGRLVLDERLADLKRSDRLRLRCADGGPVADLLAGVAGVSRAESVAVGIWQLTVDGSLDAAAERLARALVEAGIALHELGPVQRDLETVFREVSEGVSDAA